MSASQPRDARDQLRAAVYGMLIDKVRTDRYPSATMMNMVEAGIDEDQLTEYAEVLIDKIDASRYPSTDMLKRLTGLL